MPLEIIKMEPRGGYKFTVIGEIENVIATAKEKNCQINIEINKHEFNFTPNSNAEEEFARYLDMMKRSLSKQKAL